MSETTARTSGDGPPIPQRSNIEALEESLSECAPFIAKLYAMLCDPASTGIIVWSDSADSILILDIDRLCSEVLPRFFKHQNRSSFIRQLNTYGFRKLDAQRCEYRHFKFIRGKTELLKEITRRRSLKRERAGLDGSEDDLSDDASPPLRAFTYNKDKNAAARRVDDGPTLLPQVIEQQRMLGNMVQQMRMELLNVRRELEWQGRCIGALYRFMNVGLPDPAMEMHMPPPNIAGAHLGTGTSGSSNGHVESHIHPLPHSLPHPMHQAQQSELMQRAMFEQGAQQSQIYDMRPPGHALGSGPVRKT